MRMWRTHSTTHTQPHVADSLSTLMVSDQQLLPLVSSVSSYDSVARSMAAVFLANVAPKLLFKDDHLINIKHADKVLHLCFEEVNDTGIASASICHS